MVLDGRNFSALTDLDPVLSEIFFQQYTQIPNLLLNTVIGVRRTRKGVEHEQRFGGFGDPQKWQGQVHYDDASPDYEIVYRPEHLTLGFKVTQEMFEDNQFSGVFDRAANLGQSFARKRQKDAANLFNNAFTVNGYDGKPLVSATHPRSKTDDTDVSNYFGTKALTSANLEGAIIQLEELGDDRGELTGATATLLLVGRQQRKTAKELVESALTPESANNAVNVHAGMRYLVHPRISGKKWFVMDAPAALLMLKWYDRILPTYDGTWDNGNTLVRSWYGRMRYTLGWSDWRCVVGANPA